MIRGCSQHIPTPKHTQTEGWENCLHIKANWAIFPSCRDKLPMTNGSEQPWNWGWLDKGTQLTSVNCVACMARCLNHGIHWIRITYGCNDHFFCTETRAEVVWQIWGRSKKCRIVVNLNLDVKYSTIYQKTMKNVPLTHCPDQGFSSKTSQNPSFKQFIYSKAGVHMVHLPDIRLHTRLRKENISIQLGESRDNISRDLPRGTHPYRPKQLASGFRPGDSLWTAPVMGSTELMAIPCLSCPTHSYQPRFNGTTLANKPTKSIAEQGSMISIIKFKFKFKFKCQIVSFKQFWSNNMFGRKVGF